MNDHIDIDDIRKLSLKPEGNGQKHFRSTFAQLQDEIQTRYGITISEGVRRLARDMFQSVLPNIPYVLEFIVNELINSLGREHEEIVIQNPLGIYNLCAGIGRAKIDGKPWRLNQVTVEGDVGTYYGGMGANHYIFHHIKGCAGRSFMDNAQCGKVILEGVADDSAAQVNHGAYFLFKSYVGPRLGSEQRGGSIVTLENLPFNAGLFMSNGDIITLGTVVEDELGPDMQEGRIYCPSVTPSTLGKGTAAMKVDATDYPRIAAALNPFIAELDIRPQGASITDSLTEQQPCLMINGVRYDFSTYYKILPQRLVSN